MDAGRRRHRGTDRRQRHSLRIGLRRQGLVHPVGQWPVVDVFGTPGRRDAAEWHGTRRHAASGVCRRLQQRRRLPSRPPAATPATCAATPGGAASGGFTTANGQIIAPDGSVYIAKGINLYDQAIGSASQVLADFPGLNFIRLAAYSYSDTASYLSGFISADVGRARRRGD